MNLSAEVQLMVSFGSEFQWGMTSTKKDDL